MTDHFRHDRPQYNPSITIPLPVPSANSMILQKWALTELRQIYRPGYAYKKAGIILSEITDVGHEQSDFFACSAEPDSALMSAIDAINLKYGKGTLKLNQDGSRHQWQMRQERKSPAYTTNWNEIPLYS